MESRVFQIQKPESESFKGIQDAFSLGSDTAVVADGATQGFRSGDFAKFLVDSLSRNSHNLTDLPTVIKGLLFDYRDRQIVYSDNLALQSLEKAKSKKGATSTLSYVSHRNGVIEYFNVGDSSIMLVDAQYELKWCLHASVQELESDKNWINSNDDNLKASYASGSVDSYKKGDRIILLSDALARYFLEDTARLKDYIHINDFGDFERNIKAAWNNKELEKDDITLAFWFPNSSRSKEYLPTDPSVSGDNQNIRNAIMEEKLADLTTAINRLNSNTQRTNELIQARENSALRFRRIVLMSLFGATGLFILFFIVNNDYHEKLNPLINKQSEVIVADTTVTDSAFVEQVELVLEGSQPTDMNQKDTKE